MSHTERTEDCNRRAAPARLTPEERKRARGKRSQFLSGNERARPDFRKSGRGVSLRGPQAGARATHRGHTQRHTHDAYRTAVRAHSSRDHFGQGRDVRGQGHGRHACTYCQGGDSDQAALRAMVSVAARLGSWPKMASTQESGISFGRFDAQQMVASALFIEKGPTRSANCPFSGKGPKGPTELNVFCESS